VGIPTTKNGTPSLILSTMRTVVSEIPNARAIALLLIGIFALVGAYLLGGFALYFGRFERSF
jgi:hypothetical protein